MKKVRIQFSKSGPLCYIGHLDFLKVFQQTIRRAGVDIAYSQGFNPHMQLSFALPLPLGMNSKNDYADIVMDAEFNEADMVSRLNASAPDGLVVHTAWEFLGQGAAALAFLADYHLNADVDECVIDSVLGKDSIIIPKKTKSGVKDTDIRPDIINIVKHADGGVAMRLAAGSSRFINPVTVAGLLLGREADTSALTRVELFDQNAAPLSS